MGWSKPSSSPWFTALIAALSIIRAGIPPRWSRWPRRSRCFSSRRDQLRQGFCGCWSWQQLGYWGLSLPSPSSACDGTTSPIQRPVPLSASGQSAGSRSFWTSPRPGGCLSGFAASRRPLRTAKGAPEPRPEPAPSAQWIAPGILEALTPRRGTVQRDPGRPPSDHAGDGPARAGCTMHAAAHAHRAELTRPHLTLLLRTSAPRSAGAAPRALVRSGSETVRARCSLRRPGYVRRTCTATSRPAADRLDTWARTATTRETSGR